MQRNIILGSITLAFLMLIWIGEAFSFASKPDTIYDLEGEQKKVNEKFITAQILSQSLDRVYQVFKQNLNINRKLNKSHEKMPFLDDLTDIIHKLNIKDPINMRPLSSDRRKTYTVSSYYLEIECSYEKLGKFIAELEKNDRLIEINEFEIVNGYERVTSSNNLEKLPDQLIKLELATISLNKTKS
jgi:Tfp pilus assembly protein PilO